MKIKILTDLSITIPESFIKENDIGIIPIKLSWEEKGIDGIIKNSDLFKKMRESTDTSSPKTSQPSIGDFKTPFEEALKENDFVIFLSLSSKISGTYNAALQAKKFLKKEDQDRIFLIDTLQADAGLGLILLKTIELVKKGVEVNEIVKKVEEIKKHVYLFGFTETFEWLEKGGRLTSMKANIIRKVQKIGIRPLLELKKGVIGVAGLKLKAKDKKEALLKELKRRVDSKKISLIITHGDCLKDANYLKGKIEQDFSNIKVLFIEEICVVIGAHIGPDAILFSFLIEND